MTCRCFTRLEQFLPKLKFDGNIAEVKICLKENIFIFFNCRPPVYEVLTSLDLFLSHIHVQLFNAERREH